MLTPLEQNTSDALLFRVGELTRDARADELQTLSVTLNHIVAARLAAENNLRDEFSKCHSNGECCGETAQGTPDSSEAPAETSAAPAPSAEPVSRTRRKKADAAPAETPAVETPAVGNETSGDATSGSTATTELSSVTETPAAPEVDPALAEDEPVQTPAELRALSKQRYLKLCADYQNDDAKLRSFKDNVASLYKAAGADRIAAIPDDKIAKFYDDMLSA